MGSYLHIYIGPVARASFKPKSQEVEEVQKHKEFRACGSSICPVFNKKANGSFCPMCGNALVVTPARTVVAKVKKPMSPPNIFDLLDQAGFREDALHEINRWHHSSQTDFIFFPTCDEKKYTRKFLFTDLRDTDLNLSRHDIDMAKEMDWFTTTYAGELAVVRNAYDTFEIDWLIRDYWC